MADTKTDSKESEKELIKFMKDYIQKELDTKSSLTVGSKRTR
jgi:hypothetical protein